MSGYDGSNQGRFRTSPADDWVVEHQFEADRRDSSDEPFTPLLIDRQYRLATSEHYTRTVQRLNSSEGVKQLSQLDLAFDPKIETLTLHAVRLWRDCVLHDRLEADRIQLLQREQNLELQIYDGRLSALSLIEDVRVGDVLDVSFTLQKDHEAYADHFFGLLSLQWPVPMEAFRLRVLAPNGTPLRWKTDAREAFEPEISSLGDEAIYEWALDGIEAISEVPMAPWWCPVLPMLQLSAWESWEQVGSWVVDLWQVPLAHEDLTALAETLKSDTTDPKIMAQRAVDFVQQEIRYLGLEDGIGSFKPSAPAEVLRRRFGDCKDKSLLLSTLLRILKIPAAPVLVSGRIGKGVADHLPMPSAFDHVIVRLQVDGRDLWIDATDSHSRGPLEKRWPPEFGFGLQIHSKSPSLVPIPQSIPDGTLLRVREDYELGAGERPAKLEIHTLARGLDATRIRSQYSALGAKKFASAYEQDLQGLFPKVERIYDLVFIDDPKVNEIEITEMFAIPDFTRMADDGRHRVAVFTPIPLRGRLVAPPGKEHQHPWPLNFPCSVRNRIRVTMPWRTEIDPERTRIENEHSNYEFRSRQLDEKTVELLFGYDSLSDHVPSEKMGRYRVDFERMAHSSAYILALDGSSRPSWDKSAGGGGLPGSVREKSGDEYDKSYGKSPNLAWAGGGTIFVIFVWLAFKALRVTSRNSSSGPGHHPDYEPSTPTDYTEVMSDAVRNALDDVRLGSEDVLPTNDRSSRSETSFGTSLDLDGLETGQDAGSNAPSIRNDSQFRFD